MDNHLPNRTAIFLDQWIIPVLFILPVLIFDLIIHDGPIDNVFYFSILGFTTVGLWSRIKLKEIHYLHDFKVDGNQITLICYLHSFQNKTVSVSLTFQRIQKVKVYLKWQKSFFFHHLEIHFLDPSNLFEKCVFRIKDKSILQQIESGMTESRKL